VYVNGHEWLARQMDHQGVEYAKLDNAFLRLSDAEKAQKLADGFERVDWVHVLDRYAMRVNPLLGREEVLATMRYYWVTAQSEYSTDILFRRRADLEDLMPRLCQPTGHATLPAASRAWADRQNPPLPSLARIPCRSTDHDHRDQTQGSRLPQPLRRRLIHGNIFARNQEPTEEVSTRHGR
jgi:hypothetical protein